MKPTGVFVSPRPAIKDAKRTTALRVAMDEEGTSFRKVGALAEVNPQTVHNMASGVGGVEKEKAKRIAAAVNRTVGALFMHKDGADLVDE